MSDTAQIIRGVLIQVADARLLLPNATIAEVLSFANPEPLENAPGWLLPAPGPVPPSWSAARSRCRWARKPPMP